MLTGLFLTFKFIQNSLTFYVRFCITTRLSERQTAEKETKEADFHGNKENMTLYILIGTRQFLNELLIGGKIQNQKKKKKKNVNKIRPKRNLDFAIDD